MLSFGGIPLQAPSAAETAWIEQQIPIRDAFGFMRPHCMGDALLNPRSHFAWALARPFKLNSVFMPWGASRWGYAFVLADGDMHDDIAAQGDTGNAQEFVIDDGVGNSIATYMFQLPAIPLSNIRAASPALPLYLLPLVDERQRWWEVAPTSLDITPFAVYPAPYPQQGTSVDVIEGTTTWLDLYGAIGSALGISIAVDPIDPAYLLPGNGFSRQFQYLPLLLDLVASSVGQRIVRALDGSYNAYNASTAQSLQVSQANQFRKYAGASLDLGVIDA